MPARLRGRNQGGYMLVSVLAMLGLLSIFAAILIGMTVTALRVSSSFRDDLDKTSASDSALDGVVHDLQKNPSAAGTDCFGSADLGGGHTQAYQKTISFPNGDTVDVIIDCDTSGGAPYLPQRDVTLVAYADGDSAPSGKARFEIVDEVGGLSRPGNELRICDWQLGRNIRSSVAACS